VDIVIVHAGFSSCNLNALAVLAADRTFPPTFARPSLIAYPVSWPLPLLVGGTGLSERFWWWSSSIIASTLLNPFPNSSLHGHEVRSVIIRKDTVLTNSLLT